MRSTRGCASDDQIRAVRSTGRLKRSGGDLGQSGGNCTWPGRLADLDARGNPDRALRLAGAADALNNTRPNPSQPGGWRCSAGAAARRFQRVAALTIPLSFYLFFLSGGISVIAFLPEWVQTLAQFVPTYYGMHALQMAVFYNSTEDLGRDLAVLIATTVVMLALAVASLRRRLTA